MKFVAILPALLACAYAAPAPAEAATDESGASTGTDAQLSTDSQAAVDAQGATNAQLEADVSPWLWEEPASATKPRESISKDAYDSILRYATFASASRQQPCNKPPFGSTVVKEFNINEVKIGGRKVKISTQASLYNSSSTKEFVLAIPGTDSLVDWGTNVHIELAEFTSLFPRCSNCKVHSGFATAYVSLLPGLTAALLDAVKANPDYTITISGYSLGGALAKLAYVNLKTNSAFKNKIGKGYSYGEPRNSDKAFADFADKVTESSETNPGNFYRVTHDGDWVPKFLKYTRYVHSSTEYFLENPSSGGKPTLATSFRCFGQEPADCNWNATENVFAHNSYPGLHDVQTCK